MSIIPIEVAMQHVYADEADQPQVERKLASAIETAEQFIGRRIYSTVEELNAARVAAAAQLSSVVQITSVPVPTPEGEVLQLQHQHNPETVEADYLQIIDGKTSRLFMMATKGAAILQGRDEHLDALGAFAYHFGNAFQMIDDVLDFTGDAAVMGKNLGDDLAEGKPTLPIIKTLEILKNNNSAEYDKLRIAVQTGKVADAGELIALVQTSGALDYCKARALEETKLAQDALSTLPNNRYRDGLYQLTELASSRLV